MTSYGGQILDDIISRCYLKNGEDLEHVLILGKDEAQAT